MTLSRWPCLLHPSFIIIKIEGDVKEPTILFGKGYSFRGGVVYLLRIIRIIGYGWVTDSLRGDEIKPWLTPSAKQRRNPCSGLPVVYPELSTHHDWRVKKGICFVCRDRQPG